MPQIPATEPTVIASTAGATLSFWWVYDIDINASNPANVWAQAVLRQCYYDANGNAVVVPGGKVVKLIVPDLMNDPDPNVQAAITNIIQAVITKASAQNLL